MNSVQEFRDAISEGVKKGINSSFERIMWVLFFASVTVTGMARCTTATDSTDAGPSQRSGMNLRIDYGTGCQYLETSRGGITPRLDDRGNHICGAGQ